MWEQINTYSICPDVCYSFLRLRIQVVSHCLSALQFYPQFPLANLLLSFDSNLKSEVVLVTTEEVVEQLRALELNYL